MEMYGSMMARNPTGSVQSVDMLLTSLMPDNKDGDWLQRTPKFVHDTSKFWYKPFISREDVIRYLRDKPAGSFIIRDSNTYPGAYGMAVKVDRVPDNVP